MAVPVDIVIKDSLAPANPIEGVTTNVYNVSNLSLIASGTSSSIGVSSFLLPGSVSPGTEYEVRFFKSGTLFSNPVRILVIEPVIPPQTNTFDVTGTLTTIPVSSDPRMCRCTGQFIDFRGLPISNTLIRITAIQGQGSITPPPPVNPNNSLPSLITGFQVPKVLDGKMVASQTMELKTDQNGKVSIDLIRLAQFYVSFAGEEDSPWCISVPDRSSANLIELIHPQPVSLAWDNFDAPGNAVSLIVGASTSVKFDVLFSNFFTYSKELAHLIQFNNSDGSIVEVVHDTGNGQVNLRGLSTGTSQVSVSVLSNLLPSRIPNYAISSVPLTVTVA